MKRERKEGEGKRKGRGRERKESGREIKEAMRMTNEVRRNGNGRRWGLAGGPGGIPCMYVKGFLPAGVIAGKGEFIAGLPDLSDLCSRAERQIRSSTVSVLIGG